MEYVNADTNEANDARRAKVKQLTDMVRDDLKHWEYAFKRMRKWREFARGLQWPGMSKEDLADADREYVANITMRHLKQRTASIYAKNPSYVWRKSQRMTRTVWDGTAQQLQMAQMMVQGGMDMTGMYQMILQDAMQSRAQNEALDKVGETMSNLYSYFLREQMPPTKMMMKKQVLTSLTCGVAYFKQTFQRVTDYPPEVSRAIQDHMAEIWDQADNLVYTICDGYPDYLEEPHEPITYTERFYPWFVYAPNAVDDPDDPFPPSDVELMQPMQMEINRSGEALRQHRYAARPGWVSGSNLPDEDVMKIEARSAHSLVVLKSLTPDEDVRAKFQAFPTSPIDMNLYQTSTAFTDILRSVGTQEANLGGTSNATATETSIAESSRQSTLTSAIDEFDDLLTEMARAGGQILLQEMSQEQVKMIVGPGAVWPDQSREDVAREIHLEVVAGSSGRPNQAQEVAIMERVYPLLFQLPGISYEQLVRHGVKVLDDKATYEDWVDMTSLPIMALNGQMQATANRGEGEEGDNGQGGGDNAERPDQPQGEGGAAPGQQGFGPAIQGPPMSP